MWLNSGFHAEIEFQYSSDRRQRSTSVCEAVRQEV
jgi:hypothetical protein